MPLQDLEVVGQARDDGLHASHLEGTSRGGCGTSASGPRLPRTSRSLDRGHPGGCPASPERAHPTSALLSANTELGNRGGGRGACEDSTLVPPSSAGACLLSHSLSLRQLWAHLCFMASGEHGTPQGWGQTSRCHLGRLGSCTLPAGLGAAPEPVLTPCPRQLSHLQRRGSERTRVCQPHAESLGGGHRHRAGQ